MRGFADRLPATGLRPKLPWRVWLAVGGCVFAHDPDQPAQAGKSLWLPEVSPATLILEPAPPGFKVTSAGAPDRLGALLTDHQDVDGREWVISDGSGELHLRMRANEIAIHPAVLLPADGAYALRLEVALRFMKRLHGRSTQLLPPVLRIRPPQRRLLIQLLHAADVARAGGGPREVASLVLKDKRASLPSIEWKDAAIRKQAERLIRRATTLVDRDYLKILHGS